MNYPAHRVGHLNQKKNITSASLRPAIHHLFTKRGILADFYKKYEADPCIIKEETDEEFKTKNESYQKGLYHDFRL